MSNIFGIMPNIGEAFNVRSTEKSTTNLTNYKGPSFAESMKHVVQPANIQVADGSAAASLALKKQKEEKLEKLFSFTEAEEEIVEEHVNRINQLLRELKK